MKVMLRARAETEKQKNEIYEVMGLIAEKEHLQIEERPGQGHREGLSARDAGMLGTRR